MPRYSADRLTTFRDGSTACTATEAAGTNKILLPPGEYKVEVDVPGAPTGTSPTLVVSFSEAADGATWVAATATSLTPSTTARSVQTGYLRVSAQANAGVTANVTAVCTVGGTTPSFPSVFIGATPLNRGGTSGFDGRP